MIEEAEWTYGEWVEKGQDRDRQRGYHSVNLGWEYGGSLYYSLSACIPLTFFMLQSLG